MGEDKFDRPNRSAAQPSAHCLLKACHFPFERRVHQVIFSREAINQTAFAYTRMLCNCVEREALATGLKNHSLGGI